MAYEGYEGASMVSLGMRNDEHHPEVWKHSVAESFIVAYLACV